MKLLLLILPILLVSCTVNKYYYPDVKCSHVAPIDNMNLGLDRLNKSKLHDLKFITPYRTTLDTIIYSIQVPSN